MALSHRKLRNPVAKMALSSAAAGALVLGGTGIAQACTQGSSSGGTRDAGTVRFVNGNVITLTDQAGNTDTVGTNSSTVYESRGGAPVASGDFLVAWGTTQSDGSLMASKVRYGPAGSSDWSQSSQSGTSSQAQNSSYDTHSSGSGYGDSDQDHHDYRR